MKNIIIVTAAVVMYNMAQYMMRVYDIYVSIFKYMYCLLYRINAYNGVLYYYII